MHVKEALGMLTRNICYCIICIVLSNILEAQFVSVHDVNVMVASQ